MGLEIERKFLVKGAFKHLAHSSSHIIQGYILSSGGRTVRVRIRDDKGFLTIKGPSHDGGLSRYEWEHEIPLAEAQELMHLCENGIIDKTRYLVPWGQHIIEVDEFHGENKGLVIAEIEFSSSDESYEKPEFLGRELTGDHRFYNGTLRLNPFCLWGEAFLKEQAQQP
ncbi:MAG: CYTH domain-containing protein [Prevotella sp.]|nr:CYTH domain-containing protein [Prevotella sp.]